jgi:hypothetical protein
VTINDLNHLGNLMAVIGFLLACLGVLVRTGVLARFFEGASNTPKKEEALVRRCQTSRPARKATRPQLVSPEERRTVDRVEGRLQGLLEEARRARGSESPLQRLQALSKTGERERKKLANRAAALKDRSRRNDPSTGAERVKSTTKIRRPSRSGLAASVLLCVPSVPLGASSRIEAAHSPAMESGEGEDNLTEPKRFSREGGDTDVQREHTLLQDLSSLALQFQGSPDPARAGALAQRLGDLRDAFLLLSHGSNDLPADLLQFTELEAAA